MPKTLILPADRVKSAPAVIRADGTTLQPEGTVLVADDGSLVSAVSDVLTGVPSQEDAAKADPRKAYTADFTDAALAAVQAKIAAAKAADALPKDWVADAKQAPDAQAEPALPIAQKP